MRPPLRASFLGLTLTLALAAPAQAIDHLMRVTEVFPSAANPRLAFVELQDSEVEPFDSFTGLRPSM